MMYRRNKFGNQRTERAGRSFGSKLEAAGFDMLMLREKAGEIFFRRQQVHIKLSKANIVYIADFEVEDAKMPGELIYIECKGFETPEWRLKKRLYEQYGLWPLEIWKRRGSGIYLDETITPKEDE
jgi:hypothetical protein